MKAAISRTGSVPVLHSIVPASPRGSLSVTGLFSGERSNVTSPRISLHLELYPRGIHRSLSESDMIRSESEVSKGFMRSSGVGSLSFPARIQEEEYVSESDEVGVGVIGSMILKEKSCDRNDYGDESDFFGGGFGKGRMSCGGNGGGGFGTGGFRGGNADLSEIGAYYLEMLKSDPTSSLLLRNYGKYLHEVERDTVKAEEYYGRAILASPGDGEVLSLYGKLIWETNRDEKRARSYFDQAVNASPDDCMVLGSYAQFMWEADEDEEEEEEMKIEMPAAMVEAF